MPIHNASSAEDAIRRAYEAINNRDHARTGNQKMTCEANAFFYMQHAVWFELRDINRRDNHDKHTS